MQILSNSPKTTRAVKLLALVPLIQQLYVLVLLIFAAQTGLGSPSREIWPAVWPLLAGLLMLSVRRRFPPGSQEHRGFGLLAFGLGCVSLAEVSSSFGVHAVIQFVFRLTASVVFLKILTLANQGQPKLVPGIKPEQQRNAPELISEDQFPRIFSQPLHWSLAFALGFLVGLVPFENARDIIESLIPHRDPVGVVRLFVFFLTAGLVSFLQPVRVWRWGFAAVLGNTARIIVQLNMVHIAQSSPGSTFPFLESFVMATIGSFFGVYAGFLMRRIINTHRKYGWRAWY